MKLLICALILCTVSFGCQKKIDNTYCWTCTTIVIKTVSGSDEVNSTSRQECNYTEAKIQEIEDNGCKVTTYTSGGIDYTLRYITTCDKN